MNLPRRALTAVTAAMLAPVLPAISACAPIARTCAGQCGPPFQLQVDFRHGTSKQEAIAGMRKCQADRTCGDQMKINAVQDRPRD